MVLGSWDPSPSTNLPPPSLLLLPGRGAPGLLFRRLSSTSLGPRVWVPPCGCSGILQPGGETAASSEPRSPAGELRFQVERREGLILRKRQRLRTEYPMQRNLTLTPGGSGERLPGLWALQGAQEPLKCIKWGAHSLLCAAGSHPSPPDSGLSVEAECPLLA